jgi:UDP:flavonoid glycosyltransferase YjiC (YdhE family)
MTLILYGIQGTVNGHLARARALVPELRVAGLDIDFVLTGRIRNDYFNIDLFEGFDCYSGLSLISD